MLIMFLIQCKCITLFTLNLLYSSAQLHVFQKPMCPVRQAGQRRSKYVLWSVRAGSEWCECTDFGRGRRPRGRKHRDGNLLQLTRPCLCFQHETFEVGSAGKEEKAKQPDVGE